MPTGCCLPSCGNQIGGHKFPVNQKLKSQWLAKIKRLVKDGASGKLKLKDWVPTPGSVVCPDHFKESDYKDSAGKLF